MATHPRRKAAAGPIGRVKTTPSRVGMLLLLSGGLLQQANATVCEPTLAPRAAGAQVSDAQFDPRVEAPAFEPGGGPSVSVDAAHHNYHTADGRYAVFANALRADGFVVNSFDREFSEDSLKGVRILVIANPLDSANAGSNLGLPTFPAFSQKEIDATRRWVDEGGALLLIADHMPYAGAAASLARAFGVVMINGFATDKSCSDDEFLFERGNRTLVDHGILSGRGAGERVEYVRSFTGQAFRLLLPGEPLLRLPEGSVVLLPREPWEFSRSTPQIAGDGLLQGAVLTRGRGRVAVFGEAAMFSAQVSGEHRRPMGMNAAGAEHNLTFLLNVVRWLAGVLPERQ